jgi:hypothetical protein
MRFQKSDHHRLKEARMKTKGFISQALSFVLFTGLAFRPAWAEETAGADLDAGTVSSIKRLLSDDPCRDSQNHYGEIVDLFQNRIYAYPKPYAPILLKAYPELADLANAGAEAYDCLRDRENAMGLRGSADNMRRQLDLVRQGRSISDDDLESAYQNSFYLFEEGRGVKFRPDFREIFSRRVQTIRLALWGTDLSHYDPDTSNGVKDFLEDKGYRVVQVYPALGTADMPCGPLSAGEACLLVQSSGFGYRRSYSYTTSSPYSEKVGEIRDTAGGIMGDIYEVGEDTTLHEGSSKRYKATISTVLMMGPHYRIVYTNNFERSDLWKLKLSARTQKMLKDIPKRAR